MSAPYPFGHFPPRQCSFKLKPIIDCKMSARSSQRERNVHVEMSKLIAIVGEALYLAGVGPRVAYPMFDEDFEVLGAYAWIDNHIVRYPSLEPI